MLKLQKYIIVITYAKATIKAATKRYIIMQLRLSYRSAEKKRAQVLQNTPTRKRRRDDSLAGLSNLQPCLY